jgi:membrane protease YdiL (CAAX protease family)
MGEAKREGWFVRWWRGFVVAPLQRAEDEARANILGPGYAAAGRKALIVLILTALFLTLQRYLCMYDGLYRLAQDIEGTWWGGWLARYVQSFGSPFIASRSLPFLRHFALGCLVFYFVLPALVIWFVFRERLADYGWKLRGAFADYWVYLVMFAIVGPLVLIVSRDSHFQHTYPFLYLAPGEPLWPDFWIWEGLYALQFLALEFFFRGFMLHGLRPRFGAYAIPVMTVPYCMIHLLAKPLPESLASIIAGLALGFMSLRTRSVLMGAAIHITVALSMDFASLWRQGYFG